MKRKGILSGILLAAFFILTSFSLRENPQDPPHGKKKHINAVKIIDGKKMKLDTVVEAGKFIVWNGDTIGNDLKWISKGEFNFSPDSLNKFGKFEYVIKTNEDNEGEKIVMFMSDDEDAENLHEFVVKKGDDENMMFIGDNKKLHEFKSPGNSFWVDDKGKRTILYSGNAPKISSHAIKMISDKKSGNVIDLSDPNIISFKKKKLKNGREKIEIIRKEVPEDDNEDVEVIIDSNDDQSFIHMAHPEIHQKIKVISKDDGSFTIFEDSEENEFTDEDGNLVKIKEIKKGDGSIIHIEEINEDDAKKIKVTVTEETEEKKEENN